MKMFSSKIHSNWMEDFVNIRMLELKKYCWKAVNSANYELWGSFYLPTNFPQADKHNLEQISGESAAEIKTAFPMAEHNP